MKSAQIMVALLAMFTTLSAQAKGLSSYFNLVDNGKCVEIHINQERVFNGIGYDVVDESSIKELRTGIFSNVLWVAGKSNAFQSFGTSIGLRFDGMVSPFPEELVNSGEVFRDSDGSGGHVTGRTVSLFERKYYQNLLQNNNGKVPFLAFAFYISETGTVLAADRLISCERLTNVNFSKLKQDRCYWIDGQTARADGKPLCAN